MINSLSSDISINSVNSAFGDIGETFNLSTLALNGINFWAIARLCVFVELQTRLALGAGVRQLDTAKSTPKPSTRTYDAVRLKNITLFGQNTTGPIDVISFETAREYTAVSDVIPHSPFTEGLASVCSTAGLSYIPTLSFDGSLSYLPEDRRIFLKLLPKRVLCDGQELARWTKAMHKLSAQVNSRLQTQILQVSHIMTSMMRFQSLLAGYSDLLERLQPKALFTNGFFSLEKMALIAAAKAKHVHCIDHQHGVFGPSSHLFFSPLGEGEAGLDPVSDTAWVWSDWFVQNYAGNENKTPRVAGGNVLRLGKKANSEILTGKRLGKTILFLQQDLLFVASPSDVGGIPETVLATFDQAPADWCWMIRMHPRSTFLPSAVERLLHKRFGALHTKRFTVEASTKQPLDDCLANADAVLTGSSAAALDASDAGLPVVICNLLGADLFRSAIDENIMQYGTDPKRIIKMLKSTARSAALERFNCTDLKHATTTLKQLVSNHASR